ncbi:MAG: polymerase sigma-70 factor, subfamily [Jatrophihabitantaceae bacterium]|nr:polymerase sigma-70 factor, subfamily [Jatrophihabitantaceae bacterium]
MEVDAAMREASSCARPDGAIAGDDFAAWIAPHWPAMMALAQRLGERGHADDAVQEALALAWRKRSQFDPSRGTPRAWLLALTADQCRRAYRRGTRTPIPIDDLGDRLAATSDTAVDVDLQRALTTLAPRQRLAVELFYFLGLPMAEVAQVMDCAQGTVKSTLSDARGALRTILGRDLG